MASAPTAPEVGVWLSPPTIMAPGAAKRSQWTVWQMPLPGLENQTPKRSAAVRI